MNRKRDLNSVYAWARAIAGNTPQQQQQQKKKKKKNTSKRREEEIKEEDEGEEKAEVDQCLPPRIKIQIEEVVEEKKNAESQVNPYAISDEQKTENEREDGRGIDEEEANVRRVTEDDDEEDEYVDEEEEDENARKGVEEDEDAARRFELEEKVRKGVEDNDEDEEEEDKDSEGEEDEEEEEEEKEPQEPPSVLDFLKRPPELDAGTPEEQEEFSREVSRFLSNRKMEYRPPRFYGTNLNMLQ